MKSIIISIILTTITAGIFAQPMSMEQCIEYAISNNLSHKNRTIEAAISKEQHRQSKRDLLPGIAGGSSATKQFGRSIDPTTNSFVNDQFFSANFYIDSQLELFRGFRNINSIKFQKLQHLISCENMKQSELDLSFEIMSLYYDAQYYNLLQRIVKEQVELSIRNTEKTKKQIELGLQAESDLLEIKAQQATETHHWVQIKIQYEQAVLKLKNMMNYPTAERLEIQEDIPTPNISISMNVDSIFGIAQTHIPSQLAAEYTAKASRKMVAIKRGALSPSLILGAGLYTNFADSQLERIFPDDANNSAMRTTPFADQWSQNMSKSIYVSLQIPIFGRWSNQSQVKIARMEYAIARNNLHDQQNKLYRQITDDVHQHNALLKEFALLKVKQDAHREAYTIAEKKLEKGLISIIEFYTAKNQLAEAEAEFIRTSMLLKINEHTINLYLGKKIY